MVRVLKGLLLAGWGTITPGGPGARALPPATGGVGDAPLGRHLVERSEWMVELTSVSEVGSVPMHPPVGGSGGVRGGGVRSEVGQPAEMGAGRG